MNYKVGDVIRLNGYTYVAILDHSNHEPPNLTYWRNSGVYVAHNIIWTVIAPDGEKNPSAIDNHYMPHICLFHEEVNGAIMNNGMEINEFKLSIKKSTSAKKNVVKNIL